MKKSIKTKHDFVDLVRTYNKENLDYAEYDTSGVYRYVLKRHIFSHELRWQKPIVFVMLNPSTATEFKNDPTVSRCISFAKREGCTDLYVVNLFALRATDPKKLKIAKEPVGLMNDAKIREIVNKVYMDGGPIVIAWGAHPVARDRERELIQQLKLYRPICLGVTKNGSPRHPLYVKSDQPLVSYT